MHSAKHRTPRSRSTLTLQHCPRKDGSIAHREREARSRVPLKTPADISQAGASPVQSLAPGSSVYGQGPCSYFLWVGSILIVFVGSWSYLPPLLSTQPPSLHCACTSHPSPPSPGYQLVLPSPGGGRDGAASRAPGPLKRRWLEPPPSLQPAAGME